MNSRSKIQREAFGQTLADPEFLPDAKKANLVTKAVPSSEIDRIVGDLFKLKPALAAKLDAANDNRLSQEVPA